MALVARAHDTATNALVTVHELKNLPHQQSLDGRSVKIKGVVVCYDSGWNQLYVCDGQETCYFNPHDFQTQPETGQVVEITGTTAGENALTNGHLAILGPGTVPRAKRLELAQLGSDWCEWIETGGRVVSAETSQGRLALVLQQGPQNCLVYVMGPIGTNDFKKLLDCPVRIRGINASKATNGRLELASVFAPGVNEVVVTGPADATARQVPVVSISSLLNRELGSWTNDIVHINGLVASYQPGEFLVVKDPTGIIRARVIQETQIQTDDRVDIWGFLSLSPTETLLKDAYFAVFNPRSADIAVSSSEALRGNATNVPALLTRVGDILKLKRQQAAQLIPVKLRGVITFVDSDWHNCFLQDQGDAIYVDLDRRDVRPGQWVELTGQTSPGGFAPEVLNASVRVLGETNLPTPIKVDLEDLANGHLDAHWVQMEGVIRRVDQQWGHVTLSLMTSPKVRVKVILPGYENKPAPMHLIDAHVSVEGAVTSELNSRRQLSGITLHAPGLEQIKILEPPPPDPFAMETTRIDSVATFDPERSPGRRIKLQGVVTQRMPGQGFILQDASGGLRVFTRQTNEVNPGDLVDVLGFPAIGDFSPNLEEATFRKTGTGPLPARRKTTAEQILLQGTNDSQMVEIKALLLQSVPRSANPQLVLQDGPYLFTAQLENQGRPARVPPYESGSLLRLSGVCSIQGGERHEPKSFRLLLGQADDVELVEAAPWWTARRAIVVAGGLMLAIAIALAWVALLRRQVRTQTKLIRQKLEDEAALEERYRELFENANDMVYTHDLTGRLTSINQTGERLLQRSREEILSRNIVELVVEEQRAGARQWLETVLRGAAPATAEWDFLAASGQRVKVEISTRLIEKAGEVVEVEGIARDITERKRLELEILEISNREQRRIGHDLHDGVCQQLAGIAYMTSSLAESLHDKGIAESTKAERISSLINAAINQTRGVARGLFPVKLEEHGLVSALEELAANASELFKINCRFISEQPPAAVDTGVALHLYYIALEAVANASKHGKARNVDISLEPSGDRYVLGVRDDGIGITLPGGRHSGMGIRIMHYRARVIGATLSLQRAAGGGTQLTCVFLPVSSEGLQPGEGLDTLPETSTMADFPKISV